MSEYIPNCVTNCAGWIGSGVKYFSSTVKSVIGSISSTTVNSAKFAGNTLAGGLKYAGGMTKGAISAGYNAVKMVVGGTVHLIRSAPEYCSVAANYLYEKLSGLVIGGAKMTARLIKVGIGQTLVVLNDPKKLTEAAYIVGTFIYGGVRPVFFCVAVANGIRFMCNIFSPRNPVDVELVFREDPNIIREEYDQLFEDNEVLPQPRENRVVQAARVVADVVEEIPNIPSMIVQELDRMTSSPYSALKNYVGEQFRRVKQMRVQRSFPSSSTPTPTTKKEEEEEEEEKDGDYKNMIARFLESLDFEFDPSDLYSRYREWMDSKQLTRDLQDRYDQLFTELKDDVRSQQDGEVDQSLFIRVYRRMESLNNFVCNKLPVKRERVE